MSKQSYPKRRRAGRPVSPSPEQAPALRRRLRRLERQVIELRLENELLDATARLYAAAWWPPLPV